MCFLKSMMCLELLKFTFNKIYDVLIIEKYVRIYWKELVM